MSRATESSHGDPCATSPDDADCGFCIATADWQTARGCAASIPGQRLDLTTDEHFRVGLPDATTRPGPQGRAAVSGSAPIRMGLQHLAPTAAFVLVTALWAVGLVVRGVAGEPYPALIQPAFPGVPESQGRVASREVELAVLLRDRSRVAVDFRAFFPDTLVQVDAVAMRAFDDPLTNRHPETVSWVRHRLEQVQVDDAVALEVTWWRVVYHQGSQVKRRQVRRERVPLGN